MISVYVTLYAIKLPLKLAPRHVSSALKSGTE